MRYSILPMLLAAFSVVSFTAHAQRTEIYAPDIFGYNVADAAACPAQFVDISGTGAALNLQAAGAEPADDDGGAVLVLNELFEFYGRTYTTVVVSSNGYLSFATDLAAENGADFSNDCPLPAVPDNGAGQLGRIFVLHDDLQAAAGGQIFHRHFATCPRPGSAAGESCTVIQWQQWDYHEQPGADLSFQLLLYHQSRAMVMQYNNPPGFDTASASIGVQQSELRSALVASCNTPAAIPASGALCIRSPQAVDDLLLSDFEVLF